MQIARTEISEKKTSGRNYWKAQAKAAAASSKNLVLTRKKTKVEDYYGILRAIGAGKSLPGEIISETEVSWLTAMQCLRTLETNGLINTIVDPETEKRFSKLTEKGFAFLDEIVRLEKPKLKEIV